VAVTSALAALESVLAHGTSFPALPPDVQLAVVLSPATRIEPELLRSMRLAVLPRLDVSAESELWFADWIGVRGQAGVALRPELLPALRHRLHGLLDESPADAPVHNVWAVLEAAHGDSLSPLLRLEERITEEVISGRDGASELERVLYSLVAEDRSGIVDWAYGAWKRLPAEVLRTATGWQLEQVLNDRLGDERVASAGPFQGLLPEHVAPIAGALGSRELAFTWHGDRVRIGGEPGEHSVSVQVPDTEPVLLGVLSNDGGHSVSVPARGEVWVDVAEDGFHGWAGDGRIIRVFDPPDGPVALAPADRLPSKLLARAERLAPVGREAEVAELTAWLTKADPLAVRLLYSDPDGGMRQLANALATVSRECGWVVMWPSGPAVSLTEDLPASGLLVIVDEGGRWAPDEFARLVHTLPQVARVLVLDRVAASWWEAAQQFLGRVPVSQQRVRSLSSPSRAVAASVDAFCRMLGCEPPPVVPALEAADSAREVHIAALVAVLHGSWVRSERTDGLVELLYRYESEKWSPSVEQRLRLASVVLLATLTFPLPRKEAPGLLVRLSVVRDVEDAVRLLDVYEQWYPAPDGVAGLRPGHLAAAMLRLALDGPGCLGLPGEHARALVARLLADESEAARRAVYTLLANLPASPLLREAAMAHPELVRGAPGAVAADFIARSGPQVLERLWQTTPAHATPLVTALILERIVRLGGERTADEVLTLQRELAARHADAGLMQRALRVLAEVVHRFRLRATAHPGAYRHVLLDVLGDYSAYLLTAGEKANAVEIAKQAVLLSKESNRANLTVHQRQLASALLGYSAELVEQGRAHGAVEATGNAVRIHRDLRTLGENQYEKELAAALHIHAKVLLANGRCPEAVAAIRESVAVFTRLADRHVGAYEGSLAEVTRLLVELDRS
jgi:hypothetical protein